MTRNVPSLKVLSVAVVAALAGALLAAAVTGAQGPDRQGTGTPTNTNPGTTTTTSVPDRRVGCTLSFKKKQPVGSIKLTVKCSEVARVTGAGTLVVRSKKLQGRRATAARSYKLRGSSLPFGPGETQTLALKPTRNARKAAKKALARGGAAKAKVTVGFEDLQGNSSAKKVGVTLRKKR